ncbi:uncharacterized protein LOC118763056 [Octopus sinensis]|uniref:Uncharacterized protein LOC118763056 n=1 Tax=Octopus sinensis TaxID=2607531 RepID=A0A7E6ES72_9MOLL|nr:uncharacterized protein LOC118763056 [Octopus sinensis]XP_036358184.1 uncharacterized protein LOC118763056 [Octopus sinensis]
MTSLGWKLFLLMMVFSNSCHGLPPECNRQYIFGDMRCDWWIGGPRDAWMYDKSSRTCRQIPFHTCPLYENRIAEVTFISLSRCEKKCIKCDTKVIYADMRCDSFEGKFRQIWFYDNRRNVCRTTMFYTCSKYLHRVADVAFIRKIDCENYCQRGSFMPLVNKELFAVRIHFYITMLKIILDTTEVSISTGSIEETAPITARCQPLVFHPCISLGYSQTFFPNLFGDDNQTAARQRFRTVVEPLLDRRCSKQLLGFYCGLIFPKCTGRIPVFPCRDLCVDVWKGCGEEPTLGLCNHLVEDKPHCFRPRPTSA